MRYGLTLRTLYIVRHPWLLMLLLLLLLNHLLLLLILLLGVYHCLSMSYHLLHLRLLLLLGEGAETAWLLDARWSIIGVLSILEWLPVIWCWLYLLLSLKLLCLWNLSHLQLLLLLLSLSIILRRFIEVDVLLLLLLLSLHKQGVLCLSWQFHRGAPHQINLLLLLDKLLLLLIISIILVGRLMLETLNLAT